MKLKYVLFSVLCFLLFLSGTSSAQSKHGVGFTIGGQGFLGDRPNSGLGLGFDGIYQYQISQYVGVQSGFGFSQVRYKIGAATNPTNIINLDLRANFELPVHPIFTPFLSAGFGLVGFHVKTFQPGGLYADAAILGGGGFKIKVSPKFQWITYADARITTGDALDFLAAGKGDDGYWSLRTGVIYNLGGGDEPDVIARERFPYDEFSEPDFVSQAGASGGAKDLEEYIKLKSRIDELAGNIDSKEKEISDLQNSLNDQKTRVTTLASDASNQPSRSISKQSSLSGFGPIYEEGLANYYNKNYDEAISLFRHLLEEYPTHSLASNCQFWIGESMFRMGRFDDSVGELLKVLRFDRSLKKDDAIFYLGRAYLNVGSGQKAKNAFNRLVNDYPTSDYVADASSYLNRL